MQIKHSYIVFVDIDQVLGINGLCQLHLTFNGKYYLDLGHLKEIETELALQLINQ